jgi:recombination protein RecT
MSEASQQLKQVATGQQVVERPKDFPAMLNVWLPEIKRALPRHMNGDRMSRIALTAFRRTPKLGQCDPLSVFAAVIQSSQLGLEPDTLGRSYLVPYKVNKKDEHGRWHSHLECQLIPGWKGLVDLMNRSGAGSCWTGAVFDGDDFDFALGDSPFVKHKPRGEEDPEKLLYTYAIGRVKGAEWPIVEVWPTGKLVRHRNRYNKVGESHYSFGNWEMYARKVPLLQVLKYMPASVELAQAIALSDAAEIGSQNLNVKDVIEGNWSAPDDNEDGGGDPGNEGGGDQTGSDAGSGEGDKRTSEDQQAFQDAIKFVNEGKFDEALSVCPTEDLAKVKAMIDTRKKQTAPRRTGGDKINAPQ